ncbi:hypothetical protein Ari01nite_13510 [Paractinoplanes rishiriensis]|uniref:HTH hxlR-type domain-containing protein n=1 Tax=Paractinoplanes rishiriensis TaxID=1050105 RepID=A0A919JRM5_9ACTN|nr:hypothetical protein Ari01nite_13510 [Actinoplanes rishiriensis]
MLGDGRRSLSRILELVGRPGVYQTLVTLHRRDGVATFAQINQAVYPHAERCLRALAAEGLISSPRCGSWDTIPCPDAPIALTSAGATLFPHLAALQAWADDFPVTRPFHRQRH